MRSRSHVDLSNVEKDPLLGCVLPLRRDVSFMLQDLWNFRLSSVTALFRGSGTGISS
jgi:hypothetical protein